MSTKFSTSIEKTDQPALLDNFTRIAIGYWAYGLLVAILVPESFSIPQVAGLVDSLPIVSRLMSLKGAAGIIRPWYQLMLCAFPFFLAAEIVASQPVKLDAIRDRKRMWKVTAAVFPLAAVFVWFLFFQSGIQPGGWANMFVYLPSHSRIGFGLVFGFFFMVFLMFTWIFVIGVPRLWYFRLREIN